MSGLASGEPSDAVLLRQHADGDPEAFGLLFERHSGRLWAVALRITCDPDDAADALQEAMISAFRRAADFRAESAVTTWLHRIVVNASLDLLRRRRPQAVGWSGDPDELPAGEFQPAHDSAAAVDSRLDVDAALRMLPPPQRAALVLVDMLGYSVADAAAILGISEGTVKSRCARGRTRLLPYVAHLRAGYPGSGNQTVTDGVPSEQGGGG
ncbi:MAG TPA: RNA polymerase sigma factor SigM [Trebonia sp.]|jgi:RNA polymerase sigma-70 factor (ECF subfamily)|nr:RNA polymerase sigma factor SigM [Trebonia sp.]